MYHTHYVHILNILQLEHAMVCSYSDKLQTNVTNDAKNQIFKSIFLKTRQGQGPKYWSHLLQNITMTNTYIVY